MKIIYASVFSEKEYIRSILGDNPVQFAHQAQKYHKLLVQGLASNKSVDLVTISSPPVNRVVCNKKFIKANSVTKENVKYNHLSVINLPVLKNIHTLCASFFKVFKIKKEYETAMVADVLNISVATGALLACKLRKIKTVGIVTDVPGFLANGRVTLNQKINSFIMKKFDSYLLLTEDMNTVVNKNNKPYIVIEGQVDVIMSDTKNELSNKYDTKVCIYAGSLKRIYGIEYLTKAFLKANVVNTELHIYGDGDFKNNLLEICKNNDKIKYFGTKPNDFVVKEELKASLLINPRPTNEEYTKYSFPSKNMEYMVSGTPILTTNLPGMPKEYRNYVYIIEEETSEYLSECLKDILEKSSQELHKFGENAKKFVLKEKNNLAQAEKIINLIKGIYNERTN